MMIRSRWVAVGLLMLAAPRARADGIIDVLASSAAPFSNYNVFFPNWRTAPAATFLIAEADDTSCPGSSLTGLTMVNYGTATGGPGNDITGLYWQYACGAKGVSGTFTMTYAGLWNLGGPAVPAWTWAGSYSLPNDPCSACFCYPSLNVYADIGPCPADGATIELGPGYNLATFEGGVTDDCGLAGPSQTVISQAKTIAYTMKKADKTLVAPGDTITYTVFYGKPGSVALNNIWITDSLPAYSHYVPGSASPGLDPGWDPDVGPPKRIRWTIGPAGVAGGPTDAVTFQVTVDWGNTEIFEPGSGDLAAPEGYTVLNKAHMAWDPSGCASGRVSNDAATVVRRYLFYMVGDNDLLFASRVGVPDDEITYEYYIKNLSSSKTWWNVVLWDTVPPELDVWQAGLGFEDACLGWTITPSGCAAAGPGQVQTGPTTTLLTWKLDMPPGMSISLRWRARVARSAAPGDTATNIASLLALGRSGAIGGTGHQGVPKNFVHLAPIVLRTTYISYVGMGGSGIGKRGLFITFYPLNKITNFELRAIESGPADPWTAAGGKSASIGQFLGSCVGGFGCALAFPGGTPGCKAERIPAMYTCYTGGTPADKPYATPSPCGGSIGPSSACSDYPDLPYHYIYKVVSNSPLLWQIFTCDGNNAHTFTPATTMSFSGFIHYAFSRTYAPDLFNVMNTSVGPDGTLDPDLATTVHIFWFDYGTNKWVYDTSYEVDKESHVLHCPIPRCNAHYRIVSSQTQLVVREGEGVLFSGQSNFEAFSPSRSTGNLTLQSAGDALYVFANMKDGYRETQAVITNVGGAMADYKIEIYIPRDTVNVTSCKPPWLNDTSGKWYPRIVGTVPPGFAAPANPHIYGTAYDNTYIFADPPAGTAGLWRLTLNSGGPIEVNAGANVHSVYGGGSLMHPSGGGQVGTDFWIGYPHGWCFGGCPCDAPFTNLFAIEVFCPKAGMTAQAIDETGYSAIYTTDGPDQCVAFLRISNVPAGTKKNIRVTVTGGNAIVMYNECQPSHKFFTAPFMAQGVHYDVIAPPVVYAGQQFWMTVVVVDSAGGTKTDYCGTSSFTSTDSNATIGGSPMEGETYEWSSSTACSDLSDDDGVAIIVNVTLTELGLQTLIVNDIIDGSITGLTSILVVGADVKLFKDPRFSVAASGDTVQFRVCWSNYSSATAFQLVMTDPLPEGTALVPEAATLMDCGNTGGVGLSVAYSTSTSDTMPPDSAFTSISGGSSPSGGTRWLRWTAPQAGVRTTGCGCFRVRVQ